MSDRREAAARSPGAANSVTPPGPADDRERAILLECRLEQMRSALDAAREDADAARTKLADSSAREADHARRYGLIQAELAEARAEVAALHRRLERSEALKAEIEGYLFEAGTRADTDELARLRTRVLVEEQRSLVNDRTLARLRLRVEDLAATRETLLTRVAEWQQLIRKEGSDAADLSEFLAELRSEILELEHRNVTGDAREMVLRERLAMAGIDPDRDPPEDPEQSVQAVSPEAPIAAGNGERPPSEPVEEDPAAEQELAAEPEAVAEQEAAAEQEAPAGMEPTGEVDLPVEEEPAAESPESGLSVDSVMTEKPAATSSRTDQLIADLMAAENPTRRADLLLRLGRSGDARAHKLIVPWTESLDASVRASAYEALGRLLERSPDLLEPHLRAGLADADARVRRRVALAAATARGLTPRLLLEPLKEDPDPQVRRVVREVLRQTFAGPASDAGTESEAPSTSNRSMRAR